jgi:deoxycytidine triphosphate deaminase
MTLVDHEIEKLCSQGVIVPFDHEMLNPQSLDVRIGYTLKTENNWLKRWWTGQEFTTHDLTKYSKQKPFRVAPLSFILTSTYEVFNMPPNYSAEFRLKSSRGRLGWGHVLAVWIDGGFNNSRLTLELINHRLWAWLPIYPMMRIGQIVFEETAYPKCDYSQTGRYNGDLDTQESKG